MGQVETEGSSCVGSPVDWLDTNEFKVRRMAKYRMAVSIGGCRPYWYVLAVNQVMQDSNLTIPGSRDSEFWLCHAWLGPNPTGGTRGRADREVGAQRLALNPASRTKL